MGIPRQWAYPARIHWHQSSTAHRQSAHRQCRCSIIRIVDNPLASQDIRVAIAVAVARQHEHARRHLCCLAHAIAAQHPTWRTSTALPSPRHTTPATATDSASTRNTSMALPRHAPTYKYMCAARVHTCTPLCNKFDPHSAHRPPQPMVLSSSAPIVLTATWVSSGNVASSSLFTATWPSPPPHHYPPMILCIQPQGTSSHRPIHSHMPIWPQALAPSSRPSRPSIHHLSALLPTHVHMHLHAQIAWRHITLGRSLHRSRTKTSNVSVSTSAGGASTSTWPSVSRLQLHF